MKVCFAVNNFPLYEPGGAERWMYEIGKVLSQKGHDIHFTSRYYSDDQLEKETIDNITVHSYGPKPSENQSGIQLRKSFYRTLLNINADIYVNTAWTHLTGIAALSAKRQRKPFVYTAANDQELNPEWRNTLSFNRKLSGKLGIYLADKCISYSREMHEKSRQSYHKSKDSFEWCYHGHPVPDVDIEKKEKRIIWIARFEDWKQPEKFVDIAERVDKTEWEFDLIGFGDAETEQHLQQRCDRIDNAKYIGRVESGEDWKWFKKASLFVNTSAPGWEGFPNTFVQSALCGTPIASLHCDPDDILKDNHFGEKTESLNQLEKWIDRYIHSTQKQKQYQKAAKEFGDRNFSVEKTAEHYERILTNLS